MKKLLLSLLTVTFSFVLVACDGSSDSYLVGTWERENLWDERIITIVFNADNTGSWTFISEPDVFEWSTSGNTLTKEFTELNETDVFEFGVNGNVLTLIEDGNEFIYTRVE